MSRDVEMQIYGKVSDAEVLQQFASVAEAEAKLHWMHRFKAAEFVGMVEKAAQDGVPLTLTGSEASDFLESMSSACAEAGLSYIARFSESGSEGFSEGRAWRPGMEQEFQFYLGGSEPMLSMADVRRAASTGIEAVNALVARLAVLSSGGKIELDPHCIEAYHELVASQAAEAFSFR